MNNNNSPLSTNPIVLLIIAEIITVFLSFSVNYFYKLSRYKSAITKLKILQSELYRSARFASLVNNEDPKMYSTELDAKSFAEKYYTPYFPIRHICNKSQISCWNEPQYYDMNNKSFSPVQYSIISKQHGITIGFHNDKNNLITLIIDTNGRDKPNKLGQDVFVMSYYNAENPPTICDEKEYTKYNISEGLHFGPLDKCGIPIDVYPKESLISEFLPDGCNKKAKARKHGFGAGAACIAYLKQNNWVLDKNYPW